MNTLNLTTTKPYTTKADFWRVPGRIAYIVNHSYPYSSNGYAVRTHGVATALIEHGHSMIVINRPGRPWDISEFNDSNFPCHRDIDGVRYIYLHTPSSTSLTPTDWQTAASEALEETFRLFKPSIVMAASNWENALPAMLAARRLGLPFYYEVRGFWEISEASRQAGWDKSPSYLEAVEKETLVSKAADKVFTLNIFMRDELIRRGVAASKIKIVPNAYGKLPDLSEVSEFSRAQLGCDTKHVIGYVGSFNTYEGLDDLVRSCALLRNQGVDVSLLLIGESNQQGLTKKTGHCKESTNLRALAQSLDFNEHLHFTGRVPQKSLGSYYSLIDLIVVPRKGVAVSKLVSPIKPLEAIAFGKALLVSDIAPLADFAKRTKAAATFKADDVQDLASKIKSLLLDTQWQHDAKKQGLAWIKENNWNASTLSIVQAYQKTINNSNNQIATSGIKKSSAQKNVPIKFISILDEISEASWKTDFSLFPVNRQSYKQQIESSTSSALFIESCWKGNRGTWEYAFTSPGLKHANAQALCEAIDLAKKRKMPVIFWNKEDPMHYDKFMPIASRCDIVFTTDENKVEDYKRDIPGARIGTLAFSANPLLCNPSGRFLKEAGSICFAGSYYSEGHDDRKAQMDDLLPTIIEFNGAIYDRMSKLENDRYAYPQQYKPYIRDAVPFTEIINTYKQYKLFLNVNTITDSPTMMSRRVYELLACGTPVISTPSRALEEQFSGIVQIANNAEEANKIAERLLSNEWEWLRLSHMGYREVMKKHTYSHRAAQIKQALGCAEEKIEPLVSIIMASNRPHFIDRITTNIRRQNYGRIEVIIVIQGYSKEEEEHLSKKLKETNSNIIRYKLVRDDSDSTLGSRLNLAASFTSGEYLAKMDDDDFYFENYLADMLIPFSFGDYGLVGKKETFFFLESQNKTIVRFKGEQHKSTDFVSGATLVFKRAVYEQIRFADLNKGEDTNLINSIKSLGMKIYATDPFNFIAFRSKDTQNHTWQVDDNFFLEKGTVIGAGLCTEVTSL